MKTCPDCAEQVLAAARVCKHCGYRFEPARPSRKPILPLLGWGALAFALLAGIYLLAMFLFDSGFSAERYNAIESGDSEAEVEAELGEPNEVTATTVDDPRGSFIDGDVWIYRDGDEQYNVVFVDGEVALDPETSAP
jgi:hypothetical protein